MGCGSSAPSYSTSETRQPVRYTAHGTDYTNYTQINQYYTENQEYQRQKTQLWQEYQQQQQYYLQEQQRLEQERNQKLQRRLQEKIAKRKQLQQQNYSTTSEVNHVQNQSNETTAQQMHESVTKPDSDVLEDQIQELEKLFNKLQDGSNQQDDSSTNHEEVEKPNQTSETASHQKGQQEERSNPMEETHVVDNEELVQETTEESQTSKSGTSLGNVALAVSVLQSATDVWKSWTCIKQTQPSGTKLYQIFIISIPQYCICIFYNYNYNINKGQFGYKFVSIKVWPTSLSIALDDGIGSLRVDVIDTVQDNDVSFITTKPEVIGDKFVDLEFEKNKALGKHARTVGWKRPQVL